MLPPVNKKIVTGIGCEFLMCTHNWNVRIKVKYIKKCTIQAQHFVQIVSAFCYSNTGEQSKT